MANRKKHSEKFKCLAVNFKVQSHANAAEVQYVLTFRPTTYGYGAHRRVAACMLSLQWRGSDLGLSHEAIAPMSMERVQQ